MDSGAVGRRFRYFAGSAGGRCGALRRASRRATPADSSVCKQTLSSQTVTP